MKFTWAFLGFLLGGISTIYAQTVQVLDAETHYPIERVQIIAPQSGRIAISDDEGEADLSGFEGETEIIFSVPGYETMNLSFETLGQLDYVVSMVLSGVSLQEVVISASKFEEKQADVVQKIQVMRATELKNLNQTSMADVISSSGNVMVQKSQLGGGSPIIRGFETNRVLMVVDGVRMNNAIYRGGHLQNVITLDNAVMDRVELVFGPGSVAYGSDALGGVMHFFTKNPTLSSNDKIAAHGNAYLRYFSAAGGLTSHADVSIAGKKFGSLTSITQSNFGDLRQGAVRNPAYPSFGVRSFYVERINELDSMIVNADTNLQVGSAYSQIDVMQKFMFQQSATVRHILNVQFSTSSDVPRYDRLTQVSGGLPRFAQWYYGPQKRLFAAYNLDLSASNALYDRARVTLGYQNIEESRIDRRFRSNFKNHRIEKLDIFSLNADLFKQKGRHEFRYGLEAYYNNVHSTAFRENIVADTTAALDTRYPDGGSSMQSAAVYGTHTWEIGEKWVLNDGLRLTYVGLNSEWVDQTFFPFPFQSVSQQNMALNGNLGLVFNPSRNWRLALGASTGFRAPNVDDVTKVFESVQGNVVVPNPELKPEYAYNGELSVSRTFDKRVIVSATGYYTLLQNALTVQPGTFNGQDSILYDGALSQVTTTTNAGEAYIYGVEGALQGNLNEYLSVVGSVNYTYGRLKTDTTDYPMDHIPPVFGKLGFNVHVKKFRGDFFTQFSGWKRLENYNLVGEDNIAYATADGMPAWYTLNARLTYAFIEQLSLQVACENILDQNYRVFASNISAPGRNFVVTLRANW